MRGLVADANFIGHFRVLLYSLEGEAWSEFWRHLNLSVITFADLGLRESATDREIWQVCQQAEVALLTGNRNKDGPDSLEATLQESNTASSLPVFTVGDPNLVLHSKTYVEKVVERLLGFLMDIDNYRGTGRLYLP